MGNEDVGRNGNDTKNHGRNGELHEGVGEVHHREFFIEVFPEA